MRERHVFEQAIGIENPDARDAYVVTACQGDGALLAGVRSLLRHHDAETRLPGSPTNADSLVDIIGAAADWEDASSSLPPPPFECGGSMALEQIGAGGMGRVYRATCLRDDATVAIKFLLPQESLNTEQRRRFQREMEIVSSLRHEAIVPCLGTGIAYSLPFLVMPFFPAGSLAGFLARGGAIALAKAVWLFDRILAGVAHAHDRGVVHRDLKPANILLARTASGRYRPLVADFGLAKLYDSESGSALTISGVVGGSLPYMPIEQLTAFREVRPATDVWSLAAIFHEAVTGRLPRVRRRGATLVEAILDHDCGSRDDLTSCMPEAIAEWLEKGLARDAADRYEDAGAMREALSRAAAAAGVKK
ncbi:MAG: serine/threonine protein kinase [Planctomycetia bacterium]|nr:serine/threonine protein kinase [Planctomycetia bacterium]